ncbi:MAG: glycosyl hydrolase family 18 protein [Candidatus Nomurabacteria bacterium]
MKKYFFILFLLILQISFINNSLAANYLPKTSFSYSVWIPYWARWGGTDELLASSTISGISYNSNFNSTTSVSNFYGSTSSKMNLDKLDIISPFTFNVDSTGAFLDKGNLNNDTFNNLIKIAQAKKIKIYPTVLWTDANQMDKVLSDKDLQQAILTDIEFNLNKYNFDGIDIDFEGKKASTKNNFSSLLKLVSINLHKKSKGLICTIEARTPLVDTYSKLTNQTRNNVEYANDYSVIGKYCDQVRIMSYDQIGDDTYLNNINKNIYYRPVSDTAWVEKVIKNTIKYGIPANKLVLGVATYGYKYEVATNTTATTTNNNKPDKYGSVLLNNQSNYSYGRIGSMNYSFANDLARSLNIVPTRNSGGELEFSYSSTTDISNTTPGVLKTYYVEYSDSKAIEQKIALAKKYKLAGISIFKIDGNNDHNIWNIIKK